jgi:hypothetical protein
LPGHTITTDEIRTAPCDHQSSKRTTSPWLMASQPPDPPCLVHIEYLRAIFITTVE